MKFLLSRLLLSALAISCSAGVALAQEPVSTGTVKGIVPDQGTVTIQSDQTHGLLTFHGLDRSNIFTSDGQTAMVSSIEMGMKITVQYSIRGNRWVVSKVMLPPTNAGSLSGAGGGGGGAATGGGSGSGLSTGSSGGLAAPASQGIQVNVEPPTTPAGRAMRDGDITTVPTPNRPRVDRVQTAPTQQR